MKRLKVLLIAGVLITSMAGCASKGGNIDIVADSEQESGADQEAGVENAENNSDDAGSVEAYEALIAGEGTVSFKYCIDNMDKESEVFSYEDEILSHLSADKEYTLPELKSALNEIFANEENGFMPGEINSMEYAYLDCGADGVKELALRMRGPFVEENSSMTYVIKEIDSKLQVVYAFAGWWRNNTEINEFGYITGGGSNGASNHGWDAGYVNADGKYSYGFYEEVEADIEMYASYTDHDDFTLPTSEGLLCVYTLYMGDNQDETYYSYAVNDGEKFEEMDIPNLYTDSEYKDVMDCFKGQTFITMDELRKLEEDRLQEMGVTDQIKNGKELNYQEINF